jgi:hypothetical protein
MKIGLRKPSINKRIAARTSPKRYIRHNLGLKAPRGMGWLTNPRKAAYNRVYNRTSFSIDKFFKGGKGGEAIIIGLILLATLGAIYISWIILREIFFLVYELISKLISADSEETPEMSALTPIPPEGKQTIGNEKSITSEPPARCICPRCSSPMVKRVAKRGSNKGNEFYGCSNFPRCRGTRSA